MKPAAETRLFAYSGKSLTYAISRLLADLDAEANHLVGGDRLKAKQLIGSLERDTLALLVLCKRMEQGVLPR